MASQLYAVPRGAVVGREPLPVGVEEEFRVLDRDSRELAPRLDARVLRQPGPRRVDLWAFVPLGAIVRSSRRQP